MSVDAREWMDLFRKEYLDTYVRDGGSVVKVVVADAPARAQVGTWLAEGASEAGYLVAKVDATVTRVHMIQEVFFAVARQMDWEGMVERRVRKLLNDRVVAVPEEVCLRNIRAIAEASGGDESRVLNEIRRKIRGEWDRNRDMAKDFRTADAVLSVAAVCGDEEDVRSAVAVKAWLTNQPVALPTLKRLQIYQRIGRHNARLLLHSLARWVRRAGWSGLCLVLDLAALHPAAGAQPGGVKYTRQALLDTYEVLRLFIDETDESSNLAVVALADTAFADDTRRGVEQYNALKLRLVHDVVGGTRENPLTAMVRVAGD